MFKIIKQKIRDYMLRKKINRKKRIIRKSGELYKNGKLRFVDYIFTIVAEAEQPLTFEEIKQIAKENAI